ncbi:PREDICTED: uncharacterized protein LOC104611531 [Nelumbo nucifera]|uniref:Uncharacterized protein n=2 Tax=Nelumbo nucifera TaxID=4432 RepID=A0A822ZUQ1_NELNU|nr:PREDICTED: uncharacterized protein LOC104611531 [Nelumbo nucifera]DAD47241.1 TPA_asm: hypothetical protein HUJ06_017178 [Nelumbo nucifera]
MRPTEYQGSSVPLAFLGRSILSIRRNQVISMEGTQEQELEDLEIFQNHIVDRFLDLSLQRSSSDASDHVDDLSIAWVRKLLDSFLCCESEFKALFFLDRDPSHAAKPPLDRFIPELLDRMVKALDVCNAVTHGIDSVRHCQKLAEIAVSALKQKPVGEGQVRRARKALSALVTSMTVDDREGSSHNRSTERVWSFGRKGSGSASAKDRSHGYFRSLSGSVSKTWSAAKQIQAMSANLMMPRGWESTGQAMSVYIMSTVLVVVMWTLVAAIPCQDRAGLLTHFAFLRQLGWASPITGLQERIAEEWKKKEKKGSAGLLDEMQRLERCSQRLIELADSVQFPVEAEQMEEIRLQVAELAEVCQKMEEGLLPLQHQIREVFHRIAKSRAQVVDVLDQAAKLSTAAS